MPLTAQLPVFKKEMEAIIKKHAKDAFAATFDIQLGENATKEDAKEKTSEAFANAISAMGAEMADKYMSFIQSALLVPVLASPAGPVTGTISIT